MNNFQRITQDIKELIKFLVEITDYDEKYWKEYLERYDKDNGQKRQI